eukprot:gnl/MRDRNA2_/MRDRNA2_84375_c3_seq1.p2 gnl/MRDRNA2_/MRDRNA2_84375_c3~~gnl/MRDRNA2_/MRDRNA2_84375_c3_seq1.p2  ORF type:complete len:111 (+),score=14.70 gnl/MRDRNA2_/MRDRNA2_84375_c3_seq1:582-914(+)
MWRGEAEAVFQAEGSSAFGFGNADITICMRLETAGCVQHSMGVCDIKMIRYTSMTCTIKSSRTVEQSLGGTEHYQYAVGICDSRKIGFSPVRKHGKSSKGQSGRLELPQV